MTVAEFDHWHESDLLPEWGATRRYTYTLLLSESVCPPMFVMACPSQLQPGEPSFAVCVDRPAYSASLDPVPTASVESVTLVPGSIKLNDVPLKSTATAEDGGGVVGGGCAGGGNGGEGGGGAEHAEALVFNRTNPEIGGMDTGESTALP